MNADNLENETLIVPPIYNFVSSSANPLTWGEFSTLNKKYGCEVPSVKAVCGLFNLITVIWIKNCCI